jgi:protocatechuate 3,4-dioxygenase alpha subunit
MKKAVMDKVGDVVKAVTEAGSAGVAQAAKRLKSRNLRQTPSQTVGPFFAYGIVPTQYGYGNGGRFPSLFDGCIADDSAAGEPIEVLGRVFDGDGKPIPDAVIEVLQADSTGKYVRSREESLASGFRGFGRVGTGTDPRNEYRFQTVKPGATRDGQAPHLDVIVLMRGLLLHAFTRAYFDGEPGNATDPVLVSVPAARRRTLIATLEGQRGGRQVYRFDIRMQGADETVFFDV